MENKREKLETSWLEEVTQLVEAKYNTTHINIVAHSMGGLDSIKMIEDGIHVGKLVTLGTPVTGSKLDSDSQVLLDLFGSYIPRTLDDNFPAIKDLETGSTAISSLIDNSGSFDPNTKVLSYAGEGLGSFGDGVVTEDSAFGLEKIATNFESKVCASCNHMQLHSDPTVLSNVASFLWGQ